MSPNRISIRLYNKNLHIKARNILLFSYCLSIFSAYAQEATDTIQSHRLQEVVVEASNDYATSTKTTYIPAIRQKNVASNLVSLLDIMAITELQITPDNAVKTISGDDVALFIDYTPASGQEISGINVRDVKRVEVLTAPTDPRFLGAQHVVNFIMKKYEYGGYTRIASKDEVLGHFSSQNTLYSKFSYKKMTYDLNISDSYVTTMHGGSIVDETYRLASGDVSRTQSTDNYKFEINSPSASFRAMYVTPKMQLTNTVSLAYSRNSHNDNSGTLIYNPALFPTKTFSQNSIQSNINPSAELRYIFFLPKNSILFVAPQFKYINNEVNRTYTGAETLINNMNEKAWIGQLPIMLSKQIRNHNIGLMVVGMYYDSNLRYTGNTIANDDMSLLAVLPVVSYSYQNQHFNGKIELGATYSENRTSSTVEKGWAPVVNLFTRYAINQKNALNYQLHINVSVPSGADVNPMVVQSNELMYYTGNPLLKNNRTIATSLEYTWLPKHNFNLSGYVAYQGAYNRRMQIYRPYDNGNAILNSYANDGDYNRIDAGLSFKLKLFDGKLQLTCQPSLSYYHITGEYHANKTVPQLTTSFTYYAGDFYVRGSYRTGSRQYGMITPEYSVTKDYYYFSAGWGNSHWNVSLDANNFLHGNYRTGSTTIDSPYYTSSAYQLGYQYSRCLELNISYTFGYGKKVQQGNEIDAASTQAGSIR